MTTLQNNLQIALEVNQNNNTAQVLYSNATNQQEQCK
jgi:hypothetical protein